MTPDAPLSEEQLLNKIRTLASDCEPETRYDAKNAILTSYRALAERVAQQDKYFDEIKEVLGCHKAYIVEEIKQTESKVDDLTQKLTDAQARLKEEQGWVRTLTESLERRNQQHEDLRTRNQILRTRPDLPMTDPEKAAHKQLEQQHATLRERVTTMDELLQACDKALNAWLVTYVGEDEFDEKALYQARQFLAEHGGTLAYVASLCRLIKQARATGAEGL